MPDSDAHSPERLHPGPGTAAGVSTKRAHVVQSVTSALLPQTRCFAHAARVLLCVFFGLQYEKLSIPYPADTVSATIDANEKKTVSCLLCLL